MSHIKWSDNFSVGIRTIDDQHKKLIDLTNQLGEAMNQKKGNDVIDGILNGLVSYTQTHFSHEEYLFEKFKYPDTEAHKREHQEFIAKVGEFLEGYKSGKQLISIRVINFLNSWLLDHIKGSDKKYSSFLIENGADR